MIGAWMERLDTMGATRGTEATWRVACSASSAHRDVGHAGSNPNHLYPSRSIDGLRTILATRAWPAVRIVLRAITANRRSVLAILADGPHERRRRQMHPLQCLSVLTVMCTNTGTFADTSGLLQ